MSISKSSAMRLRHAASSGTCAKIIAALLGAGFVFDPQNKDHCVTMHEGRYTKYRLPYKALAEGKGILRSDVQIETTVFPLRREAVDKPVTSFINEAYERDPELPKIACSSVLETAAEKFVALTWRGVGVDGIAQRARSDAGPAYL
jgi:Nucleotidyl transferase AbiEii toxin, Type IV TA system